MLISSWEELVQKFPELKEMQDRAEVAALRDYLKSGGILKVEEGSPLKIVYPTKKMVDERISSLRRQRTYYVKELNRLKSLHRDFTPIRLAFDPLYMEHQWRVLVDRKYREAFEKLGFTWKHFLDPNTRKIIREFMHNLDYRERVLQAIDESPVYKSRKFGSLSDVRRKTREEVLSKRMELLQRKIDTLERQITTLALLKRWM